ncbi:MAG: PAS domain S-box protein [Prochloraceae cyanobacterium]
MRAIPSLSKKSFKNTLKKLKKENDRLKNKLKICNSQQYRLLETIPHMAWIATSEGKIVYANQKWLEYTGVEVSEKQANFLSAIAPQQQDLIFKKWQQAVATKRSEQIEISLYQAIDKTYNSFLLEISPVFNYDGKIDFWTGICIKSEKITETEAKLEQKQQFLQALLDNLAEGIVACNDRGELTLFNRATEKFHGLPQKPILPEQWSQYYNLYLPDGKTPMQTTQIPLFRALQGESVQNEEMTIVPKRGKTRHIVASADPIYSRSGEKLGAVVAMRDITARVEAEAQIIKLNRKLKAKVKLRTAQLKAANNLKDDSVSRELQTRSQNQVYSDIFKNIQIGLCIWHVPNLNQIENFYLVAHNPAASKLLQLPLDEYLSQKWIEIFPDYKNQFFKYFQAFAEVIRSQKMREFDEFWYQKPGYSQIVFALKVFPLPGNCVGITFEDITRRKQTELALVSSNRQYSNVVNNVREVIFQTDTVGRWTFLNPAWEKITKYSLKQSIDRPFENYIFGSKSRKNIKILFENLIKEKRKYFQYEFRCKTKTGIPRWLEIKFQLDRDENGNILGTVGTIDDISDRKEAEVTLAKRAKQLTKLNANLLTLTAKLEKRNQELDSFAHVISHDLKEPLRGVAKLSQWLQEDLKDKLDDNTTHQMNLLQQRVERMQKFIDGLLQYSRLGKIASETELINLNELLADIIDSIAPPEKFSIQVTGVMPSLYSESLPLQQVFFNLISNSIKHHHREDGTVMISHRDIGNFYEFIVSDNGPGIAPQDRDKIFIIFKTLLRKKTNNTGIGLSIVKKIIEDRGGTIQVESQLGKGATFKFTWPKLTAKKS